MVGGVEDVPVVSVEKEGPESGQAAEEDITERGVEEERSPGGTPPGSLSEDQPGQPAGSQQTEESPLEEEIVVPPLTGPLC